MYYLPREAYIFIVFIYNKYTNAKSTKPSGNQTLFSNNWFTLMDYFLLISDKRASLKWLMFVPNLIKKTNYNMS